MNDPSQLSLLLDVSPSDDVTASPTASTTTASTTKIETASPQSAPPTSEPKIEHPHHLSEAHRAVTPKAGTRRIMLDQTALDYQLLRSKRHTIGFAVSEEGLRVTAPRWVPVSEIELAIIEKQNWIFNKMNEQRERSVRRLQPPMRWQDGATIPYLGTTITIKLDESVQAGVRFDEAAFVLYISLPASASEQQLKDRVLGWLQSEAKKLFAERLAIYAEKLQVRFQSFALSSAATQWGSCTAEGRIRLNWRLMHFALPNIDYVIAHELAHLREMNHGPEFWATVQSVFPEFAAVRKALRNHEPEKLPIF
jgi:predicted metal-dependent hydrolase